MNPHFDNQTLFNKYICKLILAKFANLQNLEGGSNECFPELTKLDIEYVGEKARRCVECVERMLSMTSGTRKANNKELILEIATIKRNILEFKEIYEREVIYEDKETNVDFPESVSVQEQKLHLFINFLVKHGFFQRLISSS